MQNADEFGDKLLNQRTVAGLLLLGPAIVWWAALAVSIVAAKGLGDYLGGSGIQVLVLVVCPLLAAIMSLTDAGHSKLRWLIIFTGVVLAGLAILASFRDS